MPPKNRHKNKNNKPTTSTTTTTPSTTSTSTDVTSAAATDIKENGHIKPVFDTKDPVVLKNRGNDAFKSGNYRLAIDLFSAAIDVEPTNHVLFSNRSACYAALKEYEKALEDAELCIQAKPDWFKAYFRKGQALESVYQYPAAMQAYRKALEHDKTDATLNKAHADLTALLDELKMSEKQIECINNPDSDRFERMVRWLKTGGAKFPKLYLQYYSEDYRGVHCLTKVPADDQILYVPFPLIMTSQVAMESEVGQSIIKAKVDLRSKHSYLASYLLQEKHNPNTIWRPYLDILPAHYNNMPIFFGPDKLKLLKGSFTLAKIADRIDSLRKEYDGICQLVPSFSRFTHEEFVWARLVVITRIFGLVIRGLKTDGLVPYADMLNHKKPQEVASADATSMADTKWTFDDNLNGFTITALRSIPRGEQVFDSYGRKCNSRFFVNYGFSLDDNEEDNEVVLKFSMNPADPFYSMKLRFVNGREILTRREFQIPATYRETSDREHKTKEMFSYLRFIHAKDSELMFLSGAEEFKLDDIDPLSTRNEIEVLKHVKQSALEQLAEFDDTLEHDNKLLASNTIKDSNIRNCIVMRRGEKQVLHWYVELAEKCIPLLEMPWKDLKRVSAKSYQSTSAHDYYIKEIVVPLVKKSS